MLINAGISKVIYLQGYADHLSMEMLSESGIEACAFVDLPGKKTGG
jgi:deoxycytidylate deaminase